MARYTKHNAMFSFDDSINFEKAINFRDAMFMACKENIYDLVIINSIDAVSGIYCLGLHRFIPVVMYTHLAMMLGNKDVKNTAFSPEFFNYFVSNSMLPGLTIGTQTEVNKNKILNSFSPMNELRVLPMPIPEPELLNKSFCEKEGVLFIGRHEQGKNPDVFVKSVIKAGLKAKIITNTNGAKKFEDAFKAADYSNYEIKIGVIGHEKVEFIKSAKVYFNPSVLESFGFTMLEGLSQLPTLVLEGMEWHESFESMGFSFHKTSASNASEKLIELHNISNDSSNLSVAIKYNENAISNWSSYIEGIRGNIPTKCKFTSVDDIFWEDYLASLGRTVSIEDIQNGYRNRDHFIRHQSNRGTWLSKSGNAPPVESVGLEDFV
jgi:glycosyltransferase involved in cell wall biosynthesis